MVKLDELKLRIHDDTGTIILATNRAGSNFHGYIIRVKDTGDEEKYELGDFNKNWVSTFKPYPNDSITADEKQLVKELIIDNFSDEEAYIAANKLKIDMGKYVNEENGNVIIKGKASFNLKEIFAIIYDEGHLQLHKHDGSVIAFKMKYGVQEVLDLHNKYQKTKGKVTVK